MPTLVVTGVSSGLGLTSLTLLLQHLTSASPALPRWRIFAGHRATLSGKADKLGALAAAHPERVELVWLPLDLRDKGSVEDFARRIKEEHGVESVEVVLLNAALWTSELRTLEWAGEKWAEEAVVNHLAQQHLLSLLLPLLETAASSTPLAAPPPRIIYTTSALYSSIFSLDDLPALLGPFSASNGEAMTGSTGKQRYAASKLASLVSACALQESFASRSLAIDVSAVSPGFVPTTALSRESSALGRWAMRNLLSWAPFAVSEDKGARRILRALPPSLYPPPSSASTAEDPLTALLSARRASRQPQQVVYLSGSSSATLEDVSTALGGPLGAALERAKTRSEGDEGGEEWQRVKGA
ncbi:hypothetical protein JCM10213_002310 [Rhodosporidiobolus nylandii]